MEDSRTIVTDDGREVRYTASCVEELHRSPGYRAGAAVVREQEAERMREAGRSGEADRNDRIARDLRGRYRI